ncbi:MAG: TonB-dependent receptor [Acidobacteriota bacterium]
MKNLFRAQSLVLFISIGVIAQSLGTAGSIFGLVTDPNGAVVAGASVSISNALTGYSRTVTTATDGTYRFNDIPPNNYVLKISASGFGGTTQAVNVRSTVPMNIPVALTLANAMATVDIQENETIVENVPTTHVDVDASELRRLPLRTPGNGLSDAVTMKSPGVVADSNGFFHPLGDHAQTQFTIDNQPITDQQSKAFSTQIPVNAIQSLEVITGATPAEYGDKTSLVVNAITKSGINHKRPTGSVYSTFGNFGSYQEEADVAYGGSKFGNFAAFNFDRSNRFLDAPEFTVIHDNGNAASLFDRFDYDPTSKDSFHLNLFFARNRFEIPNTFDQDALGQDQRQRVESLNIAPGYVHVFNGSTVLSINPYYRQDQVNYFPSANPFSDQTTTIAQQRRLANAGIRGDLSYVKGMNNIKVGGQYQRTFLKEGFQFGLTDAGFNPLCFDDSGEPVGGTACGEGTTPNPDFLPGLLPFDLTRGGQLFAFNGRATIKQAAAYIQDALNFKDGLTVSVGLRYDNYHGLSSGSSVQPRLGVSYLIKPTNTVLRASYTRNFETPYNENLVLSSSTGGNGLADGILGDVSTSPLKPGNRNQYNVGVQQGIGKFIVLDIDYFYKLTHNAYDFNVILNTPITFPISWDQSRIHGISFRANLANYKGLSAFFTAGHNVAKFFPPETGGLFFNSDLPAGPFLIDHDQKFQQTTQVQYSFDQFKGFHKFQPFVAFTWRYDSGLVSGEITDFATALALSGDEQQQIGLFCGDQFGTVANPLTSCSSAIRGALRLRIPGDGTENDVTNPPRIAPRHLFDLGFGSDNLIRSDKVKLSARLTLVNFTNKDALYNFNSTFSGTHFVTPRSIQAQFGITF